MRVWAAIIALFASTSLHGCAVSTARTDRDEAADWVEEYLAASCRHHVRCTPVHKWPARGSVSCHPESGAARSMRRRAAHVGASTRFDADAAARCLAGIETTPCSVRPPELPDEGVYECQRALAPDLHEGDACDPSFWECADGGACVLTDEAACGGVCVAAARRGESCLVRQCEAGTRCLLDETPRCVAVALPAGAACEDDEGCLAEGDVPHRCQAGACRPLPTLDDGAACGGDIVGTCHPESSCFGNVCTARAQAGESCAATRCGAGLRCIAESCQPYAPGECGDFLDCPDATPFCVRDAEGAGRCSASAEGAACSVQDAGSFFTIDNCPEGLRCVWGEAGGSIACRAPLPAGSPCDAETACVEGARCVSGRCVRAVGPGDACGADAVCPETFSCDAGACAPLPTLGEPCTGRCFGGECRGGVCALRPEGATCDESLQLDTRECEGVCTRGICQSAEGAPAGAACGYMVGTCNPELVCLRRDEAPGVCSPPCEGG